MQGTNADAVGFRLSGEQQARDGAVEVLRALPLAAGSRIRLPSRATSTEAGPAEVICTSDPCAAAGVGR
jgi:hypothetical protein